MGLTLVTWNVQWCCGLDGRVDPERIVATARALGDFDVLCLQEVADNYPALAGRVDQDQSRQLAAALPGYTAWFGPAVDELRPGSGRSRFGNLILTRLPVLEHWTLRLPWPAEAGVPSMPRACTVVTVDAPGLGPLRIMTTHLEYHGRAARLAQAGALADHHREAVRLAGEPPPGRDDGTPFRPRAHTARAILCGDFNADAAGPEYALLTGSAGSTGSTGPAAGGFLDAWSLGRPGEAQPPTFKVFSRTYGPTPVACDFIFVSPDLAGQVRWTEVDSETRASDHQPVLLALS